MKITKTSIKFSPSSIYLSVNKKKVNRKNSESVPLLINLLLCVNVSAGTSAQSRRGKFSKLKIKCWSAENLMKYPTDSVSTRFHIERKNYVRFKNSSFQLKQNLKFCENKLRKIGIGFMLLRKWSTYQK